MTNDNNNINVLVADDDDPTVELEIPSFAEGIGSTAEADAKTYDTQEMADKDSSPGITVSELKSDLRSRKKTISQLQYDIQQLHAKWIGLETEISARESQTEQLNHELLSSREALLQEEKLLKKRDQNIKALKTEIRQRDDDYRQLKIRLDESQLSVSDGPPVKQDDEHPAEEPQHGELRQRLSRTEAYADSLRQQSQDLIESNSGAAREIDYLSQRLQDASLRNSQLSNELALSNGSVAELQSTLDDIQNRHDEEIRLLRFELGTAQNTVVESEK